MTRFLSAVSFLVSLVALLGLAGCSGPPKEAPPEKAPQTQPADTGGKTVTGAEPFHGLLEYRAKDAKKAIVTPTLVPADEAQMAEGVTVVGVAMEGEARAYPLYVLKNHQVVNDKFGEVPIAASW